MIGALPAHLARALPPSVAAGDTAHAAADAAEADAVASYVQLSLGVLQGSGAAGAPPPPAAVMSGAAAGQSTEGNAEVQGHGGHETAEARLRLAREQLKRAYSSKLQTLLLPGRAV